METVEKFLDMTDRSKDISALMERHGLALARKWNNITPIVEQRVEHLFYCVLGGVERSPLGMFHADIRKKLIDTDPASVTIYECIGRQDSIVQCLNDLPELRSAALLLVLKRCSDLAEWELMMSDDIGSAAKALIPEDALFLSTLGEPLSSLKPEEMTVYLLIIPAS